MGIGFYSINNIGRIVILIGDEWERSVVVVESENDMEIAGSGNRR